MINDYLSNDFKGMTKKMDSLKEMIQETIITATNTIKNCLNNHANVDAHISALKEYTITKAEELTKNGNSMLERLEQLQNKLNSTQDIDNILARCLRNEENIQVIQDEQRDKSNISTTSYLNLDFPSMADSNDTQMKKGSNQVSAQISYLK